MFLEKYALNFLLLIKRESFDYIYIAITNQKMCESIREELIAMGIDCEIGYYRHFGGNCDT